ncbi:MAG: DUF481 domain-containing protein, partial [Pedosphaera parvula]|nr:DUF481 domain-containing protein [Pedosphaera parvula]
MKSYGAIGWGILWICLQVAVEAHADSVVLHLKNGDRLTGKIVVEDARQITILTPWQKEVAIPLPAIDRRETLPDTPKKKAPAPPEASKPPPGPPAASAPPPPPATPKPKPKSHWAGQVNLGLDMVKSETDRELYQGSFNVTYSQGRFRNIADYRAAYGETAGRLSANRMDGSLKTDFDLGARRRVF